MLAVMAVTPRLRYEMAVVHETPVDVRHVERTPAGEVLNFRRTSAPFGPPDGATKPGR
jgi:hypothetical protein